MGADMFSVIFDMDGTLLDTQRICIPAWDYAGKRQGYENMGRCIPFVCGMNNAGSTRYLQENFKGINVALFKDDVREYINKNGVVKFKDGAKELLELLKQRKIKIALASGTSRKSVEHHLNEVDAKKYFDVIVAGEEVVNGKPAPDVFLKAAQLLGAEPETCYVFEDSANGIKAGYTAGMKCIGIADIVPFNEDVKKMMFIELNSLKQAKEKYDEIFI